MQTQEINYQEGGVTFNGFVASPDTLEERPIILIVHDWSGLTAFPCEKAKKLAQLGYVGFAVDVFGEGKTGNTTEEKMALAKPLFADRGLLLRRIQAAYQTAKTLPGVDQHRIGAMGFCFGGMTSLDLARSGADLRGVVSFHGQLSRPEHTKQKKINAKILAMHGHDDPMVPPEQVLAFQQEMTDVGADWQMHIYGNTKHAFTNPQANDLNLGIVYNASSDRRSWLEMRLFWEEVF